MTADRAANQALSEPGPGSSSAVVDPACESAVGSAEAAGFGLGDWSVGEGLAAGFREAALPAATRAAYAADWARFTAWTARAGLTSLPADPAVVGEYLAEAASVVDESGVWVYAPSTLARWTAGINAVHRAAGYPSPGADPAVAAVLRGIRATRAQPPRRVKPLRLTQLTVVLQQIETVTWPGAVIGRRDYALLLAGFAGALRRSELAHQEVWDVEIEDDGTVTLRLRRSKTDQDAAGATVAYPRGSTPLTCTACALLSWGGILLAWQQTGRAGVLQSLLQDRGRSRRTHRCASQEAQAVWPELRATDPTGPVFRSVTKAATISTRPISGATVAAVVQRRLTTAGIDPAGYAGHSLRAGFVTDAFTNGANAHEIMRQTRHASPATLEAYARHYTPLEGNAVTRLGL